MAKKVNKLIKNDFINYSEVSLNKSSKSKVKNDLYSKIKDVIEQSRSTAYKAVNFSMVIAYWNIGKIIVEDEQSGKHTANYGDHIIQDLSQKLTKEFGKGFTERNIRNMRQFYLTFPIWHTVRAELTWSHYRSLLRVNDDDVRAMSLLA